VLHCTEATGLSSMIDTATKDSIAVIVLGKNCCNSLSSSSTLLYIQGLSCHTRYKKLSKVLNMVSYIKNGNFNVDADIESLLLVCSHLKISLYYLSLIHT
jgi:hypothetical protein